MAQSPRVKFIVGVLAASLVGVVFIQAILIVSLLQQHLFNWPGIEPAIMGFGFRLLSYLPFVALLTHLAIKFKMFQQLWRTTALFAVAGFFLVYVAELASHITFSFPIWRKNLSTSEILLSPSYWSSELEDALLQVPASWWVESMVGAGVAGACIWAMLIRERANSSAPLPQAQIPR